MQILEYTFARGATVWCTFVYLNCFIFFASCVDKCRFRLLLPAGENRFAFLQKGLLPLLVIAAVVHHPA